MDLLTSPNATGSEQAKVRINNLYSNIVQALTTAAGLSVPKCKQNFFKFWWNEQCEVLKDESVNKHRAWVAAGRPREAAVDNAMC